MRLTTILLIATIMQVSANSFGQAITLNTKNASLPTVIKEISRQSGYDFFYDQDLIKKSQKITVNISNSPIETALEKCFENQPFTYKIENKSVLLKAKEPSFRERIMDRSVNIDVRGRVYDDQGMPLSGAVVRIKGANNAVGTDASGSFHLINVPEGAILVISFVGYGTEEVKVTKNVGMIVLKISTNELEEMVINAGYYTVKEKERTGSISRVDAKTIAQQPVSNPLAALIGRMPGVNIEQSSGINGGGFKVQIRGQNSLRTEPGNNGNDPLYLIDGVPYPSASLTLENLGVIGISGVANPLSTLNPNDIESIEVLKDADATAIYGSRGANGVILITTKKAKPGATQFAFIVNQGISQISKKLNLLNTEQYFQMRNEAFKNDGVSPAATDYDINGTWDKNRYTDWQKELIGGTASSTNVSTSIGGGNEFTQFAIRGNYSRQTTVLPVNLTDIKGSGALTINHSSFDRKLSLNFSSSYNVEANTLPKYDLTSYTNLAPNAPALYNADGNLNWGLDDQGAPTWNNPMASTREPYTSNNNIFLSSGQISYEVVPGLKIKGSFGYSNIKFRENVISPIAAQPPSEYAIGLNLLSLTSVDTWNIEPQINYQYKSKKSTIDILVGTTLQKSAQRNEFLVGALYTSDLLIKDISSAPFKNAVTSSSLYKYQAVFSRLNYNYNGTYFLNITGRRDGSSRFGPDKQYANFGAIGVAWIFSNENMAKELLPMLSLGKIRGSFGSTGNDQIPNYGYLETYSATNSYIDGSGLFPSQLGNPDYSWEITKKLEAAIDLGLLKDRILFSASWYRNRSSNQLVGYTLPDITGFSTIQYNLPATVQNTGWEFELRTNNLSSKTFTWTTAFNLTIPKNKLLSYPDIEGSSYANTYTVGQSLYNIRKYHYQGVNTQTGMYDFADVNGNGVLDVGDRISPTQTVTSHWYGGIQNSFNLNNITLDIFIQVVNKTALSPFTAAQMGMPGSMGNQTVDVLDRWQKPNDMASFQQFSQSFTPNGPGSRFSSLYYSDRFSNASFVRLKNVSLSWMLPRSWSQRVRLQNLRVFAQGQNLLTITKYPGDPEIANVKTLPSLRTIICGLQVNL
ncbi:MAG: SusC/RagA family TonB-linked outer membrane protein [Candidatus Pedobacter colombiensis]|uniref:SusC/RagA family TonB-linked outer membrane protein n=1 Tax=Candidatus Pedobacter colombiensis TaxID=3121371 RepID=A0AAJ5WCY5_9SPHI|nr:SusC/RagA family TonB-linked outer membrane protein [Pedobacter sp.]WEK21341.1 MAG: SusC/RagA family TonB-linked outer membrane protein [Pedobacter sp.]